MFAINKLQIVSLIVSLGFLLLLLSNYILESKKYNYLKHTYLIYSSSSSFQPISIPTPNSNFSSQKFPRIVAVGDLHGDLKNTMKILQMAKIVNEEGLWIANPNTILVQTGDVVDRGPDTIKLFELFKNLTEQATTKGSKVIQILGNHELMNLSNDLRYVTRKEIKTFGGLNARKQAFKKHGFIGRYLYQLNLTQIVGKTVFAHGGIHPKWAKKGVDYINKKAKKDLSKFAKDHHRSKSKRFELFRTYGPAWYRGYAKEKEEIICPLLDEALASMKVDRMVVGHSRSHNRRIVSRCNGKFFMIDVGISNYYGGNLAALEIIGNSANAIYVHRTENLIAH